MAKNNGISAAIITNLHYFLNICNSNNILRSEETFISFLKSVNDITINKDLEKKIRELEAKKIEEQREEDEQWTMEDKQPIR